MSGFSHPRAAPARRPAGRERVGLGAAVLTGIASETHRGWRRWQGGRGKAEEAGGARRGGFGLERDLGPEAGTWREK